MCAEARNADVAVRGYLSTAFGCPYEGAIAPERVAALTADLIAGVTVDAIDPSFRT